MPVASSGNSIPDIQKLPDGALLTRRQLAEISSFKVITLKVWAKQGRGPKITRVENRPRYRAQDVREWMAAG
ncbi:DNA-binding protein [Methylobacterium sp. WL9]|uniref:helix-turn-helix transcriptional regulator n=1 Tax=Methylobacterium sp. WL9 TaxID=2603898 RepID=UPI0011CC54F2|nr:DNA-binding protein [Methylobacterium sp. WL9]TXN21539.1 DNA-binding protein [Methylobacterium sp. WL9]